MRPPRLFIDGPSLAGSAETLAQIARLSVPPADCRYPHTEELQFQCGGGRELFQIRGRLDKVRIYDLVDGALADPRHLAQRGYLAETDVLIFVVDSQRERVEAGIQRLEVLRHVFVRLERDPERIPVVFQLNKRDLPNAASEDELRRRFRWPNSAFVPTVATTGTGIAALLVAAVQLAEHHR